MYQGFSAPAAARHHHKHASAEAPAAKASSHHGAHSEAPAAEAAQAALTAGDAAGAYKLLEAAYRARPNPVLLYWLGRVAQAEKRPVAAQDYMRRFLIESSIDKDESSAALRAEAEKLAEQSPDATAEARVTGPKGGLVFVDDRLAGTLPLPSSVLLAAGTHRVAIETKHKHLDGKVEIIAGRGVEVLFDLEASAVLVSQQPVLLVLRFDRGLTPAEQTKLGASLREAFSKARSSPVPQADALRNAPDFRGCLQKLSCQLRLAEKNGYDYALRLAIDSKPPSAGTAAEVHLSAAVLDVAVGAIASEVERTCTGCTLEATAAALREVVGQVLEQGLGRPRGSLTIDSVPKGALVLIDGRRVGQTPLTRDVLAGEHTLEFSSPGQRPTSQRARVEASEHKTVRVQLADEPPEEEPPPPVAVDDGIRRPRFLSPRPRWRLIAGGVAVGAGLLLSGFGISALSQNGQCTMPAVAPMNSCGYLYSTTGVGGGLLGAGLTISLGGAGLMLWPASWPTAASATTSPKN